MNILYISYSRLFCNLVEIKTNNTSLFIDQIAEKKQGFFA